MGDLLPMDRNTSAASSWLVADGDAYANRLNKARTKVQEQRCPGKNKGGQEQRCPRTKVSGVIDFQKDKNESGRVNFVGFRLGILD